MTRLGTRWRIGVDIGGTFTDFILYDAAEGSVQLHKRLTTPSDPSDAALIGLGELVDMARITLADVGEIVHGTTLVTNAVIERKGAKLGLDHDLGLPRHPRNGHGAALRHLRPVPRFPGTLRAARPPARGPGARIATAMSFSRSIARRCARP